MNASSKSLTKYSLLTMGALICAALAGLGSFRAFPLLAGQVKRGCLVAVAGAMAVQGAAFIPRKPHSRLLVKREAMMAGGLILFAGAALLLVLLFAGCSPATAKLQPRQIINFYGMESTRYWSLFSADVPASFAAQEMP
jgi:hypothetical protein